MPTQALTDTWEPAHPLEAVSHQSKGLGDRIEATPQISANSRSPGTGKKAVARALAVPGAQHPKMA